MKRSLGPAPGDRRRRSHRDRELGSRPRTPTPHRGALHVTKTCAEYHGAVGEFCTIESSNIDAIKPGMQVVYLQAPESGRHAGQRPRHLRRTREHRGRPRRAERHDEQITFLGGTGKFAGFHADAVVSVDGTGLWHWDGTYSFG